MPSEEFERAVSYPYRILEHSYVIQNGEYKELAGEIEPAALSDRVPILAVGSNQSPEQLARKFSGPQWSAIPVIRAQLADFDTVYSPHITSYGSIPSTLQWAPGAAVTLFVTWLDREQLKRMHETEIGTANYGYGSLTGIKIEPELGPPLESVFVYASRRGAMHHSGSPISVAEIPATGRKWPARTQMQVQAHVRDRLAPEIDLDEFIRDAIDGPEVRRARTEMLERDSQPFNPPDFVIIEI